MLTFRRLLAQTKSAKQRQALLAGKVEDMINTVVRQIAFYSFRARCPHRAQERRAHRDAGSRDLGCRCRREPGPGDRDQAGYENYWMYIPHFIHSPFYVYAYCLRRLSREFAVRGLRERDRGLCRALSRHARSRRTKHYSELLRPFGLDARIPKFWDGACRSSPA